MKSINLDPIKNDRNFSLNLIMVVIFILEICTLVPRSFAGGDDPELIIPGIENVVCPQSDPIPKLKEVHHRVDDYKKLAKAIPKEDWRKFAQVRYGYGTGALAFLDKLGTIKEGGSYQALIFDTGLVFHNKEFLEFLKEQKELPNDPWELREQFKSKLGYETFYRSMALTPLEVRAVRQNGIKSETLRGMGDLTSSLQRNLGDEYSHHVSKLFDENGNRIISDQGKNLISVTKNESVGNLVASGFKVRGENKIYEFTLKLPKLDILYASKEGPLIFDGVSDGGQMESLVETIIEPNEISFGTPRRSHFIAKAGYMAGAFGTIIRAVLH